MFKKLCSLLLCVAMLACVLTACGETPAQTTTNDNSPTPSQTNPPSDQQSPKKPTTPEEYISTAWEKMLVSDYQETEVRNKTMIMNGAGSLSATTTCTYLYGEQYAVTAPADADSYTEVDSFDQLFT